MAILVTGKDCPARCVHNDFNYEKNTGPGFFFINVTGAEPSYLWVSDGSQQSFEKITEEKRVNASLMEIQLVTMRAQSIFVGHGYLKHATTVWSGTQSILYHMYLISQGQKLMVAVSVAYGWSFRKSSEHRHPFSSILDVPTIPIVSQPSSTVYSQVGSGANNGGLGNTTKHAKNEGTQCVKWTGYTKNEWEDESTSEEPSELEAESYGTPDDDYFSISGEDDIFEG